MKITPTFNDNRINLKDRIPLNTPLVIYVEPSGFCNLRCSFCPNSIMKNKSKMTIDLFMKLIDELELFEDRIKLLRICGFGEPLLNKKIVDMIRYAYHKVERIELVTNGLLLDWTFRFNLSRYVDRTIISLEGMTDEEYKKNACSKVNVGELIKKIEHLCASKLNSTIHVKVINTEYKELFFKTFDFCDEAYIENIVPLWAGFDSDKINTNRWGNKIIHKNICPQIFKGLQIYANGDVVPCCVDWERVNILGNINTVSLAEIWKGSKLKELQKEHLQGLKESIKPCNKCLMNDYCEKDIIT
jgi:radical SAM protein with 4Fe4S-binding SPASM domain